MDVLTDKKWWKAAITRIIKTMAQTLVAAISTGVVISDVDWGIAFSTMGMAGILSFVTSLAGLPEVKLEAELEVDEKKIIKNKEEIAELKDQPRPEDAVADNKEPLSPAEDPELNDMKGDE